MRNLVPLPFAKAFFLFKKNEFCHFGQLAAISGNPKHRNLFEWFTHRFARKNVV
jgi:hypothetical protein